MSSYRLPSTKQVADFIRRIRKDVDPDLIVILDQDPETGVVLVDYKTEDVESAIVYIDGENPSSMPSDVVRGSAFAIVNGECVMVCPPTPRRPTVVTDDFEITSANGQFVLSVNTRAGRMSFNSLAPPTFTPFVEGARVRIWKFRGKVYHSNNKSLSYDKTMWNGCSHKATFERLGLPSDEELFPKEVVTDPRCHIFLAVDYHFVTDSRQILTKDAGYIVYVGAHFAFEPSADNIHFKRESHDDKDAREYAGPWPLVPFVYNPPQLDVPAELDHMLPPLSHKPMLVSDAKDFLKHGYFASPEDGFPDPRMTTGDSLHVQLGSHALRIQPPSSFWRNQIRAHDPDVKHMIYTHLAQQFTGWKDFEEKYMYLDLPSEANLVELYKPHMNEDGSVDKTYFVYSDLVELTPEMAQKYERDHKLYRWLVFCNVLMSLSYQDQINSLHLFNNFENERSHAINYIFANYKRTVYHVDPEKFTSVGRVNDNLVAPPGKKYLADSRGFVRDVTSIKLRPGQSLALLPYPHIEVKRIVGEVGQIMEENRRSKTLYRNERTLINKEFNQLAPNYVFQILKQAKAWYP